MFKKIYNVFPAICLRTEGKLTFLTVYVKRRYFMTWEIHWHNNNIAYGFE